MAFLLGLPTKVLFLRKILKFLANCDQSELDRVARELALLFSSGELNKVLCVCPFKVADDRKRLAQNMARGHINLAVSQNKWYKKKGSGKEEEENWNVCRHVHFIQDKLVSGKSD